MQFAKILSGLIDVFAEKDFWGMACLVKVIFEKIYLKFNQIYPKKYLNFFTRILRLE